MHESVVLNETWWLRPQPAWINMLGSTILVLSILAFWNFANISFASEPYVIAESILSAVSASNADLLPYQGTVTDQNGEPVDGIYDFQFAIYDSIAGGTLVWGPEIHSNVPITNGQFTVSIGSNTVNGITPTVWISDHYIEVVIDGETLTPRELIRSLPIPDGIVTSDKLAPILAHINAPQRVALTFSAQNLVSTNIVVERPSRALIIATCDCETSDGGFADGELWINGQKESAQLLTGAYPLGNNTDGRRHTMSNSYVVDLVPGNNVIELTVRLAGSQGSGTAYELHSGLSYLVVSQ